MPIYCGNNMNDSRIVNGTHMLGSNYQCFRKGVGVGLHLPYDSMYNQPYNPVDDRKFYCGKSDILPEGGRYFAMGSPSKCLQNGVGIGKIQRAAMGPVSIYFRYILPFLFFFLIVGVIFLLVYFIKPKFLVKKDQDTGKDKIDWNKFIPYYIIVSSIVAIMVYKYMKFY